MIDSFANRQGVVTTDGEWYEFGKWYVTCTGLGEKDPAGAQLCQLLYTCEGEDVNNEYISGTMLFRGEDITPVSISGGTGYLLLAVNEALTLKRVSCVDEVFHYS